MDSYGANGTFQLYNPLRRLLDGEALARDFSFFHGVGVPLLHFPRSSVLFRGNIGKTYGRELKSCHTGS